MTGFSKESNAITMSQFIFWVLIQPSIFLMLVTSDQEWNDLDHSTGQTERPFPLVFLLDLQTL